MILNEFEKIANEIGAKLIVKQDKVAFSDGSRSPHNYYQLSLNYKEKEISLLNSVGTTPFGRVDCEIGNRNDALNFKLTTSSHLTSLLLRRKNRFNIKPKSHYLDIFMKTSKGFNQINDIVSQTLFEPTIIAYSDNESFYLKIEYSLHFKNFTQVIKPIFQFYKDYIDLYENEGKRIQ